MSDLDSWMDPSEYYENINYGSPSPYSESPYSAVPSVSDNTSSTLIGDYNADGSLVGSSTGNRKLDTFPLASMDTPLPQRSNDVGSWNSGIGSNYRPTTISGAIPQKQGDAYGSGLTSSDYMNMRDTMRSSGYGLSPAAQTPYEKFVAPEFDKYGYKASANEYAQPFNRELSRAIQKAILSSYGKPAPLARQNVSNALESGAEGFAKISSQAAQFGRSMYNDEYTKLYNTAMMNTNISNQGIRDANMAAIQLNNQIANDTMKMFMSQTV